MDESFQPLLPGIQQAFHRAAQSAATAQAVQSVFHQQAMAAAPAIDKLTPALASYSRMAEQAAAVSKVITATQIPALRVFSDQQSRYIAQLMSSLAKTLPTCPKFDYPNLAALQSVLTIPVEATVEEAEAEEEATRLTPWLVALILAVALVCVLDEQVRLAILSDLRTMRVLLDASPDIEKDPDVAGVFTMFEVYGLVCFVVALLRRLHR